jgi:AAA domain
MIAFTPARRENVSLLIGIAGASGSGKSKSALELATGLAGPEGKIAAIDTEARRLLHYAAEYRFDHMDMKPPFSPGAYQEAIGAADAAGYSVIVIDSASHEWEGEGGLHDMHDALIAVQVEAARKAHNGSWEFDEGKTRERLSVGAWREPKALHKRFVQRLLQCRAHLIMCLRADEKMRIEKVKDERGRERTVIVQAKDMPPNERWSPICERRLPYELTLSLILTPQNPGIPIPVKLQDQHRPFLPLDKQIGAESGRKLAAWARGDEPPALAGDALATLIAEGDLAASMSTPIGLEAFWKKLTPVERKAIGSGRLSIWKKQIEANAKEGAQP